MQGMEYVPQLYARYYILGIDGQDFLGSLNRILPALEPGAGIA